MSAPLRWESKSLRQASKNQPAVARNPGRATCTEQPGPALSGSSSGKLVVLQRRCRAKERTRAEEGGLRPPELMLVVEKGVVLRSDSAVFSVAFLRRGRKTGVEEDATMCCSLCAL